MNSFLTKTYKLLGRRNVSPFLFSKIDHTRTSNGRPYDIYFLFGKHSWDAVGANCVRPFFFEILRFAQNDNRGIPFIYYPASFRQVYRSKVKARGAGVRPRERRGRMNAGDCPLLCVRGICYALLCPYAVSP